MAAYLIAVTEISDHEAYDDYKRRVAPLVSRFGGRFLVRGGKHAVLEGSWLPERLVIIEFPDMEALTSWYDSPEYAPLLALRQRAGNGNLVAVEGV